MNLSIENLNKLLEDEIKKSGDVFVVGHFCPDFDSIGASLGIKHYANYYNKKAYVVVDDHFSKIESGVKKVIDETNDGKTYLNKEEVLDKVSSDSLLVVVDVNKKDRFCLADSLDKFRNVIVIDHHALGENSVSLDNMFIFLDASSASEVVARALNEAKIKFEKNLACYLLAGISLDTNRFRKATTAITHDAAEKLIDSGADINYVNSLFLEEFDNYCKIRNLMINGTIFQKYTNSLSTIQVSFTLNRDFPKFIYNKEDCAKAADRMLKFNGIDASFVLGYIDDENVHISARSSRNVNVGKIMEQMNGGGNMESAGALIKSCDIFDVENRLIQTVPVGIEDEYTINKPKVLKLKKYV